MAIGRVETERLQLQPWSTRFTPAPARINADREVMRYIGTGEPATPAATEEQSQRFARHWDMYGFGLWR